MRVADNTEAGIAAAVSEQDARKRMSALKWESAPAGPTKHCVDKARSVALRAPFCVPCACAERVRGANHCPGRLSHRVGIDVPARPALASTKTGIGHLLANCFFFGNLFFILLLIRHDLTFMWTP